MKKKTILLGILAVATSTVFAWRSAAAGDPGPNPEECRRRFVYEFAVRRDEFRAHLFGSRKDRAGVVTTLTNGQEYTKEVTGIFETKKRLTSELIEPIVQSYRTYQCKMRAVCNLVKNSIDHKQITPADIQILGCEPETLPLYPECFLATPDDTPAPSITGSKQDYPNLMTECQTMEKDTLNAERAIIRMSVAYDASYRSSLQFAGMMDWMMDDLPTNAIRPIRDMVNMLGRLHTIPCFIGQCENNDPNAVAP